MLKRVFICMALVVVLLSGGCEDMSPKEESEIVLRGSLGFIILSWLVVILLTLLGRRLNLVRNRMVLLQYGVFMLIQVIISMSTYLHVDSKFIFTMLIVILSQSTLPYLLLVGGLLILLLPARLLAWLPSFLLLPHYLMFGLQYLTNDERLMYANPVILIYVFAVKWRYLAIPIVAAVFVGLIIRRRREGSKP